MSDATPVKRAGSTADTEEDFSTVPTTTAPSESGFEDLSISETDSNVRVAASDTSSAPAAPSEGVNAAVPAAAPARQADEPAAHPTRADSTSLTSSTSGLVLFDLTDKPGGKACFSPHTIKTILDLKLLNVGYERQRLTFVQIRNELSERIADNVTVPALELSDGSHIVDSWAIAEYLERRHQDGHRLFGSSATKRLAAMLNQFGKTVLAPHIGPLAQRGVHAMLDAESADYFANVKIGKPRWSKVSSMSQADVQNHVQQAIAKLEVVNAMLTCEGGTDSTNGAVSYSTHSASTPQPRSSKPVWFAGGQDPTHADFVLFGWYVFSRAAGAKIANEIWTAHKPIQRWLDAMLEWSGDLADDFV
jgi:glutathione S-transferase